MKTTLLRASFLSAMAASMGLVACMDQPSATGPSDHSTTGFLITTPSEEPLVGSQASAMDAETKVEESKESSGAGEEEKREASSSAGAAAAAGSVPTARVAESKLPSAPVPVAGEEKMETLIDVVTAPLSLPAKPTPTEPISTRRRTRCGARIASASDSAPPKLLPTTSACSISSASIRSSACCTQVFMV